MYLHKHAYIIRVYGGLDDTATRNRFDLYWKRCCTCAWMRFMYVTKHALVTDIITCIRHVLDSQDINQWFYLETSASKPWCKTEPMWMTRLVILRARCRPPASLPLASATAFTFGVVSFFPRAALHQAPWEASQVSSVMSWPSVSLWMPRDTVGRRLGCLLSSFPFIREKW